MGHFVIREDDNEFMPNEWGRSKKIIGPENVGAKYLKVHITEYAPGSEHKLHRHPGHEEVIVVLDGEGISRTEDGDKQISPGAFAFIPADTDHATINVLKNKPLKAIIFTAPPEE
ncbi:cupin domain-containing protein [Thermodesulfobacteriota bacterium]